jgi:hypothetical protein
MKTDRRHELQTNVLADWIGKHIKQSQGYAKTVLAVVLLVAAVAIGGMYLAKNQAARSQLGWNQFFEAFGSRDPEALEVVAATNQGTAASVWAHLAEADLRLAEGIGDLYTNRDNAKKNLAEAERNYLAVDAAAKEKILRERAWFGLGQTYESLAELDKAKTFYEKLVSSAPTSALGKEAKRRSDTLGDEATAKWYNWFANQTPRPPMNPGAAGDFGLPNLPSDLENLSDRPDLSIPGLPAATSAAAPTANAPAPGPELNSPTPEPASAPTEPSEAKSGDAPVPTKEPETPAANKTPAEPKASEPAPKASDAPAEGAPASGEETPE